MSNTSSKSIDIFNRPAFETFVKGMTGVEIVHQWGDASVAKVGGKIFAILSGWSQKGELAVSFKASEMAFEMLPSTLEGVHPAPYLARAKWVQVTNISELHQEDILSYIIEAHRLVASKLTRVKKNELGLDLTRFAKN